MYGISNVYTSTHKEFSHRSTFSDVAQSSWFVCMIDIYHLAWSYLILLFWVVIRVDFSNWFEGQKRDRDLALDHHWETWWFPGCGPVSLYNLHTSCGEVVHSHCCSFNHSLDACNIFYYNSSDTPNPPCRQPCQGYIPVYLPWYLTVVCYPQLSAHCFLKSLEMWKLWICFRL